MKKVLLLFLLFVVPAIAGCVQSGDSPGLAAPLTIVGASTAFLDFLPANATYLVPIRSAATAGLAGNFTLEGPSWKGLSLVYLSSDGTEFEWITYENGKQQRADFRYQNELLGAQDEHCVNLAPPPCTDFGWSRNPWIDQSLTTTDAGIPAGDGYLLISYYSLNGLTLKLRFGSETIVSEPIEIAQGSIRVSEESFDAEYSYIRRCGDIVWCGVIRNGRLDFALEGYLGAVALLAGTARGATYMSACIQQRATTCATPAPGAGAMYYDFLTLVRSEDGPATLVLDVASPVTPYEVPLNHTALVAHMKYDGQIIRFLLPPVHPLA